MKSTQGSGVSECFFTNTQTHSIDTNTKINKHRVLIPIQKYTNTDYKYKYKKHTNTEYRYKYSSGVSECVFFFLVGSGHRPFR